MADSVRIGNTDISSFKVGSEDCKVYLGSTLLYPQSPSYTVLQGIERKANYLGYVDLGLGVGTDFKIEMKLNYKTAAGGRFFGVDSTFRWFKASSTTYFDYNGDRISNSTSTYPLNTDFTVTLTNYSMKSSLESTATTGVTQSSYTSSSNLGLFSSNISSNGDLAVVYYIKVYTDNGNTLVGNFIPVRRDSDNVVTLLNTITNTFCDVYGTLYGVEQTSNIERVYMQDVKSWSYTTNSDGNVNHIQKSASSSSQLTTCKVGFSGLTQITFSVNAINGSSIIFSCNKDSYSTSARTYNWDTYTVTGLDKTRQYAVMCQLVKRSGQYVDGTSANANISWQT